ncbi:MAG TPA: hypothetical protein VHD36_05935 [Pirellulales bacterium]|nr:hypothetical protein [Pirellulales bacterium]
MTRFTRRKTWLALLTITAAILAALSQQAAAADEDNDEELPLVVKVYRVIDLVVPVPNYPYEGTFLPGMGKSAPGVNPTGFRGGMGGMGGGMGGMGGGGGAAPAAGGGGGGGMGGGMFRVPDHILGQVGGLGGGLGGTPPRPSISQRISWGPLMNTITSLIDPESWDEQGGSGSISPIGGALAISQTLPVHAKIETFFKDLRREIGTLRQVSVEAHWVLVNGEQLAALTGAADKQVSRGGEISRERLTALPPGARHASGRVTCINGQTVHVISGRLDTKVQGAIPVVGTSPGYQATILTPHFGALLQLTPLILPDQDMVLVDLHSAVTQSDEKTDAIKLTGPNDTKDPAVQIDRIQSGAQQLATSLNLPLGKLVLVGGMSLDVGMAEGDQQLYLILEITADNEEPRAAERRR